MTWCKQRRIPLFTLISVLALGTFFSIRIFSSASTQQSSPLRETQALSDLTANFTTSKLWTLTPPDEIIITSDLNATVQSFFFATGDEVRGGQPVLNLSDDLGTYSQPLEDAKLVLESTQELYDKTQANFLQQLQKSASDIATLQQQLTAIEQDLQAILTPPKPTFAVPPFAVPRPSEEWGEALAEPNDKETLWEEKSVEESNVAPWETENLPQQQELLRGGLLRSLSDIETQLEQAKLNYELLKTEQSTQLTALTASLQTARKDYETLYTTYNKLSVRAPFAGTLWTFFTTAGEKIRTGSPLFSIIPHNQTPKITVELTFHEYLTVLSLPEVALVLPETAENEAFLTGIISTRSPVANASGMFTLTIENPDIPTTGSSVFEVKFPLQTDFFYLPKEIIESKNQTIPTDTASEGYLYLLIDGEVEKFPITLWNQRNNRIEVKTPLSASTQIITNRHTVF